MDGNLPQLQAAEQPGGEMYPRFAEGLVRTALRDTRVVVISGPRQSGKSTLARRFARQGRAYLTLDNQPTAHGMERPTGQDLFHISRQGIQSRRAL